MVSILESDMSFVDHLLVVQELAPEVARNLRTMLHEFQKIKGIAMQVLEENAYLKGRIVEVEKLKHTNRPTYAEVGREANSTPQDKQSKQNELQRVTLLVRSPDEEEGSTSKIKNTLRRKFEPVEMGFRDIAVKQIRGGIAVSTSSTQALKQLQEKIKEDQDTRQYTTKFVEGPQPEIKLLSVDKEIDSADIPRILLEQNNLDGSPEEIKVTWRKEQKFGSNVTIQLSNRELACEITRRGNVYLGWTRCRVLESVYLPKCTYCARLGHKETTCSSKTPRCTECAGDHYYKECQADNEHKKCSLCKDAGVKGKRHSMWDGPCPTYDQRYQQKRREMGFLTQEESVEA
ncbi:uncharacterized protein LOC125945154 [Dermacentor silvarum]|uniref:uncharacterized protein LOC125945154 n=1 Tax=Dermacentor silvarum TaxID=543639 RepID=UPI00210188A9|nr:uncharacterized protein LOC125945154 [Dermacentor silvarum]